jgi:hypothetical protein
LDSSEKAAGDSPGGVHESEERKSEKKDSALDKIETQIAHLHGEGGSNHIADGPDHAQPGSNHVRDGFHHIQHGLNHVQSGPHRIQHGLNHVHAGFDQIQRDPNHIAGDPKPIAARQIDLDCSRGLCPRPTKAPAGGKPRSCSKGARIVTITALPGKIYFWRSEPILNRGFRGWLGTASPSEWRTRMGKAMKIEDGGMAGQLLLPSILDLPSSFPIPSETSVLSAVKKFRMYFSLRPL